MPNVGNLYVRLKALTKDFERKMATAMRRLNTHARNLQRQGRALTMGLTLPLGLAAAAAVKFSTDFGKGLGEVATLLPRNVERVKELGSAIQDLAVQQGTSTTKLVKGAYQVISAFQDTADTVERLAIANQASVAGVAETKDAVELLAMVTKGYGDTSIQTVRKVADLAFQTVKLGVTTFPELALSIGTVTGLAKTLNVSLEELFASFATLTGVTGDATKVAVQLRGVMNAFLKQTPAMEQALDKIGIGGAQATIAQLGLVGAMRRVIAETGHSAEAIATLFPNVRGLVGVLTLAGPQAETFAWKLEEMTKAGGSMEQAYIDYTETINRFGFQLGRTWVAITVFAQKLGTELVDAFNDSTKGGRNLADVIKDAADGLEKLTPEGKKGMLSIIGIGLAIGPVIWLAGKLAKLFVFLAGALTLSRAPALVVLGIFMLLDKIWDSLVDAGKWIIENLGGWAIKGAEFMLSQARALYKKMAELRDQLLKKGKVEDALPGAGGIDTAVDKSLAALETYVKGLESLPRAAGASYEAIVGLADDLDNLLLAQFGTSWDTLLRDILTKLGWFTDETKKELGDGGEIPEIFNQLGDSIDNTVDDIVESFDRWESAGESLASTISDAFVDLATGTEITMKEFAESMIRQILRIAMAWAFIEPVGQALGGWLKVAWTRGGGPEAPMAEIGYSTAPADSTGVFRMGGVQIVDQRGAGSPPIEVEEVTGPGGVSMTRAIVQSEGAQIMKSGGWDRMFEDFGVSRRPVRRG